MKSNIFFQLALATTATAAVSRTPKQRTLNDVRTYMIYPAQPLPSPPKGINGSLVDLCRPGAYLADIPILLEACNDMFYKYLDLFDIATDCGDGTWCGGGPCQTYLGKKSYCCWAPNEYRLGLGGHIDDPPTEGDYLKFALNACAPYTGVLKEFDLDKYGKDPITSGCTDSHDRNEWIHDYPVGDKPWGGFEHRKPHVEQCCSIEFDSIEVISDASNDNWTVQSVKCIAPLTTSEMNIVRHSHTSNNVTIDWKPEEERTDTASSSASESTSAASQTSASASPSASIKSGAPIAAVMLSQAMTMLLVGSLSAIMILF